MKRDLKWILLLNRLVLSGVLVLGISSTSVGAEQTSDIRIALFDLDISKGGNLDGIPVDPKALTDAVMTILSIVDNVTLVDRTELTKVADEHKMNLAGLVNDTSALQLGKFVSANYVVVGRSSRIGQTYYLVLKIIDVQTTVQTTVSVKSSVENGVEKMIENLQKPLTEKVTQLLKPKETAEDQKLKVLLTKVKPLKNKVFLLDVSEEHIDRPLKDPAAQMAISHRLEKLGIKVVVTKSPVDGWKEALLQSGKYSDRKIDYLLEGEGASAFAARLQGLISCRARVELRLIPVPGRISVVTDRGVGAGVDLAEHLSAKKSLEEAGKQACDNILARLMKQMKEK